MNDTIDDLAFRVFASLYPREAAEQDWPRFAAYVRTRTQNAELTDDDIRRLLDAMKNDDNIRGIWRVGDAVPF